jgi:hypothetical protein
MAEIQLTQGKVAIVDDEDLPLVEQYTWHAARRRGNWYAETIVGRCRNLGMHRVILGLLAIGSEVDHRDRDGLNNTRKNLRVATRSQNQANSIGQPNRRKSLYKGVRWHRDSRMKAGGRWRAQVMVHGKRITRAATTELEAAQQYNELAMKYFGDFARLNVSAPLFIAPGDPGEAGVCLTPRKCLPEPTK